MLVLLGDGLRLSDEPLERFLAALFLQLLPDHVPAGLVVAVEPVTLRERKINGRSEFIVSFTKGCTGRVRAHVLSAPDKNRTLPLLTDR